MAAHRIVQFSDTHFLEEGAEPEGGFAYDTSAAFDDVADRVQQAGEPDLVVITGDVADHGRPAQYRRAAEAFGRFEAPVNACIGNHDQDLTFTVGLGRVALATSRVIEMGNWCHLFVDSCAGVLSPDESGRLVDPDDYDDRLHTNGSLGAAEAAWVRAAHDATDAEHVFIWLHHPPAPRIAISREDAYTAEWRAVLAGLDKVRGLGGGHTHVPDRYDFEGTPVWVAPALKNNFDIDAATMLPPGCRSYTFDDDGSIESDLVLGDETVWPKAPLGRSVVSLFRGELSWDDFNAIVARKSAG